MTQLKSTASLLSYLLRTSIIPLYLSTITTVQIASSQTTSGYFFSRNGPGPTRSQLAQWELNFSLSDYLPVCGNSYEYEGYDYWSNCEACEPAMAAFNASSLSVQIYDTAGRPNAQVAGGDQSCMCFTVEYTPREGIFLDICLLVGRAGEIMWLDDVGAGIQSPHSNEAKALPRCAGLALPSSATMSRSSEASVSRNNLVPLTPVSIPTTTPETQESGDLQQNRTEESEQDRKGEGLSSEAKIALGTGIPGAIAAIAAIIAFAFKCRKRARRKATSLQ
ncbi:hypothetical protein K402DRAFT_467011 [Aulographum hederae CBS 113979]|uniref:Uncharacterized protein n=1 Tax=Aulographum hederae CBS 113979 TaxID=1176131 RepID=A0A6G1GN14_9PEZI|nr:hypothetical protein K402DRAFT_467011 [Aulographum hederae CBS 113979]